MTQLRNEISKLRDAACNGLDETIIHGHVVRGAHTGFHLVDQKLQSLLVFLRGHESTQRLKEQLMGGTLNC